MLLLPSTTNQIVGVTGDVSASAFAQVPPGRPAAPPDLPALPPDLPPAPPRPALPPCFPAVWPTEPTPEAPNRPPMPLKPSGVDSGFLSDPQPRAAMTHKSARHDGTTLPRAQRFTRTED